ncbi:kinase-like domain-containing protein, partial [Mycena olivaceomarginata]
TTAALQSHENGGGAPGEPKIWICWQVRLSSAPKTIAASLGYHAKGWAVSLFMPDIKADIVKVINTEWCTSRLPLSADEVSFRWHGNRILDPGTHTMVLSDFYAPYSTPSNAPVYLQHVPPQWKNFERTRATKRFFEDRVGRSENSLVSSTGKRARTQSSASAMGSSNPKQPRLSGVKVVPASLWTPRPCTQAVTVQKWSTITFKKIRCITAEVDGKATLVEDEILRGRIFNEPFSSGTMKHAYDLIMSDGEQLVAKRFFQLNDDADPVSIPENRNEVQSELLRLAWGKWFLSAFYQFCKQRKEVNVDEALSFAEAFLAEEADNPSTASGVERITGEGTGLTWLVERKRPTTVTKFSGTLVHTSARRDLRSMTICAFAHFTFGFSNNNMVFADLQGTPAPVRGVDGLILFDVMTHTVEGNSGVDDFGKRGIRTFMITSVT